MRCLSKRVSIVKNTKNELVENICARELKLYNVMGNDVRNTSIHIK